MSSSLLITILSLFLAKVVLTQPDLCRNPKIDSIAYISVTNMWFFTSGGKFWYLKETEFPPTQQNSRGKLPDGFAKGDAAIFKNSLQCASGDQSVVMVEKTSSGNQIIEFNTREQKWGAPRLWAADRILSMSRIDDSSKPIDALFEYKNFEIYVVQGQHYAGVYWKKVCDNPQDFADAMGLPQTVDHLQSTRGAFDAITVKDNTMYQFIGGLYWMSHINEHESKDGKIVITKGSEKSVSQKFFQFKECPSGNGGSGSGSGSNSGSPSIHLREKINAIAAVLSLSLLLLHL